MTELDLLKVIGSAQDVHILDADELPVKKALPLRPIAALLALVLAVTLFMGAAAVAAVKAQVTRSQEPLLPPGESETVQDTTQYSDDILTMEQMEFSLKPTVEAFADEWFRENAEHAVINAFKGLDNVMEDMAQKGYLNVSVEFRPTADSDYYNYLSIILIWEDNRWIVESYGLEG